MKKLKSNIFIIFFRENKMDFFYNQTAVFTDLLFFVDSFYGTENICIFEKNNVFDGYIFRASKFMVEILVCRRRISHYFEELLPWFFRTHEETRKILSK